MNNVESSNTSAYTKKRRLSFSLLSLVILTTVCCLALGFWLSAIEPIRSQWVAFEVLREKGAQIETAPPKVPEWILKLLPKDKKDNITHLEIGDSTIRQIVPAALPDQASLTSKQKEAILKLHQLRSITLQNTGIDDEFVKKLARMKNLNSIDIRYNEGVTWRAHVPFVSLNKLIESDYILNRPKQLAADEIDTLASLNLPVEVIQMLDPDMDTIRKAISTFKNLFEFRIDLEQQTYSLEELKILDTYKDVRFSIWLNRENEQLFADMFTVFGNQNETIAVVRSDRPWVDHQMVRFHFGQPWFVEDDFSRFNIGMTPSLFSLHDFMDSIPEMPNVKNLVFEVNSFSDDRKKFPESAYRLLGATPNVEKLKIEWPNELPDAASSAIEGLEKLKSLRLLGQNRVRENATLQTGFLQRLNCKQTLEKLELMKLDFEKEQLSELKQFEHLEWIKLDQKEYGGWKNAFDGRKEND